MFEGLIEFIEQSVFSLVNQIAEREPTAARAGAAHRHRAAAVRRKNPGMTRVMVGDALVFENERLLARMNQFFDRVVSRSCARACATPRSPPDRTTPTVDANVQASVLTRCVGRLPALRALRIQAHRPARRRAAPAAAVERRPASALRRGAPRRDAGTPAASERGRAPHPGRRPGAGCPCWPSGGPPQAAWSPTFTFSAKAATFRRHGVPVPQRNDHSATLASARCAARWSGTNGLPSSATCCCAAEAHHAPATLAALSRWRTPRRPGVTLVRGTTTRAGDPPPGWGSNSSTALAWCDRRCARPGAVEGAYALAGHVASVRVDRFRSGARPASAADALPSAAEVGGVTAGVRRDAPPSALPPGDRIYVVADQLRQVGPAAGRLHTLATCPKHARVRAPDRARRCCSRGSRPVLPQPHCA